MTVINHKSISGITSITAPAGSDDLLTVHTNDTTERFRILKSGAIVTGVATASNFKTGTTNVHSAGVEAAAINVLGADTPIGTGATIYDAGGAVFTGVVTATSFSGALTGTASGNPTLANGVDNRIVTATGANTLNGESELTYNGSGLLSMVSTGSNSKIKFQRTGTSIGGHIQTRDESNDKGLTYVAQDGNSAKAGHVFITDQTSDGSAPQERLRITSAGLVGIGIDAPTSRLYVNGVSTNDIITARSADSNGNSVINILSEGTTGSSRIVFSDTAAATGDAWISYSHNDRALRFSTAGVGNERLRIDSSGLISNGGLSPSDYGSPKLLISGTNSLFTMMGNGSINNSSYTGIKFRVAGGSTGDYTKAGIFVVRQASYNYLDMLFCFNTAANATGVSDGDEKVRIKSDGLVLIGTNTKPNDINKLVVRGTSPADSFDSQCHLEGSETSGAAHTGGALAFAGHDGSSYRNWGNIYGMKENSTGGNTASYMAFHTRPNGGSPTERLRINSDSSMLHTRSDNTNRYDLEFRNTGGIGNGNYGGIRWTQGSTGSTFLSGIQIAYHDTGRPDMVFWIRDTGGSAGSHEGMRIDRDGKLSLSGDTDTYLDRNTTNTWQIKTNGTLCTEFSANQRVRMPQVYSTNGSSMRDVWIESDGTLCAGNTSIRAAKKNIVSQTDVSWLYDLNPVTFNYRKHTVDKVTGVNTYLEETLDETSYGLIAEEVETVNQDFCLYNDGELAGVSYSQLITPLLKAVQDQKKEIDTLKAEVATLKGS